MEASKKAKQEGAGETVQVGASPVESTYTARELTEMAKVFGTVPEAVRAALREKGMEHTTQAQAAKIIRTFLERTVE